MKVPNNSLAAIKTFFLKELSDFPEAKIYFEICCEVWLGLSKMDVLMDAERELTESELLLFFQGVKELKANRPVQYVVGKSWFYGLELNVREGVLIPRPETEELVDWIVKDFPNLKSILDIGTGSGCIPLSIKSVLPNAEVSAIDISKEALSIAKSNSELLGLKIHWIEEDILNPKLRNEKFEVIVSNPPYIPNTDKSKMSDNVLKFEPGLALFVEDHEPLVFYIAIAEFALSNLEDEGTLFFEIHEDFGKETSEMLVRKGFKNIELKQDLQGRDRMIKCNK